MKKVFGFLTISLCLLANTVLAADPQLWDAQGKYLYKHGDFVKSIEAFNNAIKTDSKYDESYFNRAMVYVKMNDVKAAEADFDKFLKLAPTQKTFFTSDIINTFIENKQPAVAFKYASMNIADSPSAPAYALRAKLYAELGKPKEALADANKALSIDPQYTPAYYEAGNANISLGNYNQAILNLSQFIERNPNSAEALVARASAFYKQGDKNNALNDYKQAIKLNAEYQQKMPADLK